MLKLGRRARGHFVTLIENRGHLIRVKPGHISRHLGETLLLHSSWRSLEQWRHICAYALVYKLFVYAVPSYIVQKFTVELPYKDK